MSYRNKYLKYKLKYLSTLYGGKPMDCNEILSEIDKLLKECDGNEKKQISKTKITKLSIYVHPDKQIEGDNAATIYRLLIDIQYETDQETSTKYVTLATINYLKKQIEELCKPKSEFIPPSRSGDNESNMRKQQEAESTKSKTREAERQEAERRETERQEAEIRKLQRERDRLVRENQAQEKLRKEAKEREDLAKKLRQEEQNKTRRDLLGQSNVPPQNAWSSNDTHSEPSPSSYPKWSSNDAARQDKTRQDFIGQPNVPPRNVPPRNVWSSNDPHRNPTPSPFAAWYSNGATRQDGTARQDEAAKQYEAARQARHDEAAGKARPDASRREFSQSRGKYNPPPKTNDELARELRDERLKKEEVDRQKIRERLSREADYRQYIGDKANANVRKSNPNVIDKIRQEEVKGRLRATESEKRRAESLSRISGIR